MALWQKLYYKLLNLPLSAWVKTHCIPSEPIEQLNLSLTRPIVYVLPFHSHTDLLTLRRTCLRQGLPDPLKPLTIGDTTLPRYVFISHGRKVFSGQQDLPARSLAHFKDLLNLHRQDSELDIQLVPASVLWQRDPGNETQRDQAILRAMNGPEKLWTILTRGRDGMVRISQAVSLRYMADKHGTDQAIAHKLARVAMIHFSRQKLAASGPRLPNRALLFKRLLASKAIDKVVHDEAQSRNVSVEKVRKEAVDMMEEIAANFSYRLIRYSDRLLTWLWNKLYQGINVNNAERVRQLAQDGHEIVYVPCHRSHMDYLLLSYVLYKEGLVPPHIAAGVNLNFFPAGPLFRRGGAFFIRRSFKGNRLYSTVFREYLAELFARGYSVEYFSEGGRSRTGRLLPAKTGMLAMTLQAMLRGQQRPITLVPVYIGYEHVMEVSTYAKELQGQRKEKESFGQVVGIVRKLRDYGLGYVNFGEPIPLNQHLNDKVPDWHDYINPIEPQKPAWMNPVVNDLAEKVMTRINDAAATNALTLCATALLASRQRALSREALETQLAVYQQLLTQAPYSACCSVPQDSPADLVDHALSLNKFVVEKDTMGDVISLNRQQAILMTYYRNNVIHLVALPSLIAQILITHKTISQSGLRACVQQLYPLLKAELFMSFDQASLDSYFDALLHAMQAQSLICCNDDKVTMNNAKLGELQLLGRTIVETLQRYAITLTLYTHQPHIEKRELEKHSQMLAQRLSRLHGINAPEFFDKGVFSTFVDTLREQGYLDDDAKANAERIQALNDLVCGLISPEVQLTIQAVLNQPLTGRAENTESDSGQ